MLPVLLLSVGAGAQKLTDLEKMGLRDSVLSIREIKYSTPTASGSIAGRLISSDKYMSFRPDGYIAETLVYEKGRLFSTLRYDYDDSGKKTGYKEFDNKDRLYLSVTFKYEDDLVVEEGFDRSLQKMYDDKRREIDVEYHKYYQNLYTKVLYDHNFSGRVTSAKYLNPDGSLDFRYEYTYNYKGYRVGTKYFNANDKLMWKEKFINDLTGNPIQSQRFENNRLAANSVIEYEFDDHGNWISRVETTETLPDVFDDATEATSTITIREIEYFSGSAD